jgi:hypothetical protein
LPYEERNVSGDDVRSSEQPDARKKLPIEAESARTGDGNGNGNGQGTDSAIGWVGQQHLMWGYCGRALVAGCPAVAINVADARRPQAAKTSRQVTLLSRPRDLVVRIGPRPTADLAGAPAKAA